MVRISNKTKGRTADEKPPFFFLSFNRYFFIDMPRTESRRPAFGILSPSQAVKDLHTITRTNASARIHAHARIIFASFCESLQLLNFLFTFTMKTAYFAQNATALRNVSRRAYRLNLGHLTAYFGHIPKKGGFWGVLSLSFGFLWYSFVVLFRERLPNVK